jgi:DNA-binding GntR family transcriptional regulator
MAERRVRTLEGARLFGQPIGSVIDERTNPEMAHQKRATSLTKLKSLQRQFEAAKRTGNTAAMRDIQEKFTAALKDFSGSTQWMPTLEALVASRGRNDQALGKKPELDD